MQKLLIGTKNKGKIQELREFLSDLPVDLVSLSDVGIDDDVDEDKPTYEGNSQKKALFYAKLSGLPTVADDGGLEIVALNGEPGVHSRRWLGYEATDEELIEHLRKVSATLADDQREVFFKTVVSFATADGRVFSVAGEVKGELSKEPEMSLVEGYPYRSFFYLPEIKKFYHENDLSPEEMKLYNHRYIAIQKLKPILESELELKK
jgi:XTP/dITP diphosphohydrolase